MPEGDTLHRFAAAMRPWTQGKQLDQAHIAGSAMPELSRRKIVRVWAHGKHLLIALAPWDAAAATAADNGWILRVHLGMHGSWHRYTVGERWKRARSRASVILTVADQLLICFDAQDVDVTRPEAISQQMPFAHVGPDLLAETCDFAAILRRARQVEQTSILADALLDQRIAAGIGNVYKSEIMFMHRYHPTMALERLSDVLLMGMFQTARTLLLQNLTTTRRVTTYDPKHPPRGAPPPRLFVYGRKAEPCMRCATSIVRCVVGRRGRSTYMCPSCQPTPYGSQTT